MLRTSLLLLFFLCLFGWLDNAYAQKWQPGHYTDVKGNVETGLIWLRPSGKGPVPGESFIGFRKSDKENPQKLSAGELKSFVIGRDSFVVADAPQYANWKYNTDFIKVLLDEDIKLYLFKGYAGDEDNQIVPEVDAGAGVGAGTGGWGYGGGVGIGLSIPIGHGGGNRIIYYYGENAFHLHRLTDVNFADIMSDILGDEPDVAEAIREGKYNINNMDKLIAYFKQEEASHANGTGN